MFDRNELHVHKTERQYVTVEEHRAPTDQSVELLKEMQEQIKKDFIGKFPLENNLLQATVLVMEEALTQNVNILVRYKINHADREVKIVMCQTELLRYPESVNREALSLRIFEEVARDIVQTFTMFKHKYEYDMPLLTAHRSPVNGKHFTLNVPADVNKNPADVDMKVGFIQKWLDTSNPNSWALREKLKQLRLF